MNDGSRMAFSRLLYILGGGRGQESVEGRGLDTGGACVCYTYWVVIEAGEPGMDDGSHIRGACVCCTYWVVVRVKNPIWRWTTNGVLASAVHTRW